MTHNLFVKEFVGIKAEIQEVLDLLDNTIKVVYDKKHIQIWESNNKNLIYSSEKVDKKIIIQ